MNSDPKDKNGSVPDSSAEPEKPEPDKEDPPPLKKKIPEPPNNLRRRSDWFRKRSE